MQHAVTVALRDTRVGLEGVDLVAEPTEVVRRERSLLDEVHEELLRRSVEQLVDQSGDRGPARGGAGDLRGVPVRLPLEVVRHEALLLDVAKDREHGRVGEVGRQALPPRTWMLTVLPEADTAADRVRLQVAGATCQAHLLDTPRRWGCLAGAGATVTVYRALVPGAAPPATGYLLVRWLFS